MINKNILLAVLMSLVFSFSAFAEDVVKLDMNAEYGADSFHTVGAFEFAKLAGKYSDGSVQITVYPAGELGFKGSRLLKIVKEGKVAMSDILMGGVAQCESVFGISSLPRIVAGYDDAKKLYDDAKPMYEERAKRWNQKFLYAAPWPPSGLVTKKPVKTAADLKKLKIRTYDTNGAVFLQNLGSSPVSLPWSEVYNVLRKGIIDSVLTSAESVVDGKLWDVLNEFKVINYAYPLNMVTINIDRWNALSDSQKAAMLKAAKETEAAQWDKSADRHIAGVKAMRDHGMTVTEESAELAKILDEAAQDIISQYKMDADEDIRKLLK